MVLLIPYLLEIDTEVFNPIQKNVENVFYILEQMLEQNEFQKDQIQEIIGNLKQYLFPTFVGSTIEAGVYGLCCLLMMIGASCKVRGLMLPYLILQLLAVIILIGIGIVITVGLFFMNVIMGVVAGGVVLIITILLIYFWAAVQRAYVELGNNDYMYSPAPLKPNYNDGRGAGYYPTSPQHFQMDERKWDTRVKSF